MQVGPDLPQKLRFAFKWPCSTLERTHWWRMRLRTSLHWEKLAEGSQQKDRRTDRWPEKRASIDQQQKKPISLRSSFICPEGYSRKYFAAVLLHLIISAPLVSNHVIGISFCYTSFLSLYKQKSDQEQTLSLVHDWDKKIFPGLLFSSSEYAIAQTWPSVKGLSRVNEVTCTNFSVTSHLFQRIYLACVTVFTLSKPFDA